MATYANFDRLSPNVYLHEPPSTDTTTPAPANTGSSTTPIILLCTWMSAQPRLVSRYADRFITDFPHSTVVLVTANLSDMIHLSEQKWSERVSPLIDLLASRRGSPVHACIYSNGGSSTLIQIALAYRARTKGSTLPIKELIIDSAPGSPEITVSHRATLLSISPPTFAYHLAWVLVWVYLAICWTYMGVFGVENPIEVIRQQLNDPKLFEPKTERVYIYSQTDQMVPYDWVESSAAQAKQRGWSVRMEEFKGSKHVAHAVVDKERYWQTVKDTLS